MTTATAPAAGPEGGAAIEQAEQEAAEAEQLLAALEERVRDGDEQVTAQQLADARELGTFARLRAEAARRKADRAAQAAAEQQRAAHLAEAAAMAASGGPLDDAALAAAYATARAAVRAFVTASEAYNAAIEQASRLLAAAGVPDSTHGHHPEPGTMARWGTRTLRLADGTATTAAGTGLRLAVLLDDLDREFDGIPTGDYQPPFTRTPIAEQADRGRDARPHLHTLAAEQAGSTK
ncbi:hypothetical protein GO001_21220 [Streptomyces sp. NRRL B-1677]|uniref:hypothetical protein n=1 Tax=Streptomyces sp. NRRL B-1677 TaxID=2682966 RepID=UPI001892A929|nr:hypothetical protein [Streptomyces sp. NRRL B-1677]MBF6047733.1 hypothetical protein [Streptomyces sp. NRRL B-1677]